MSSNNKEYVNVRKLSRNNSLCFTKEHRRFVKACREVELSNSDADNSEYTEVHKELCDILSDEPELDLFGYSRMSTDSETSEKVLAICSQTGHYHYL